MKTASKRIPGPRWHVLAAIAGAAILTLGSLPALADEADRASEAASADSASDSETSERQSRREQRRQEREAADTDGDAAGAAVATELTEGERPSIVLAEPEMECHKVTPTGSRMPREVCTPVVQQETNEAQQEQEAEAVLRRMRALSTRN